MGDGLLLGSGGCCWGRVGVREGGGGVREGRDGAGGVLREDMGAGLRLGVGVTRGVGARLSSDGARESSDVVRPSAGVGAGVGADPADPDAPLGITSGAAPPARNRFLGMLAERRRLGLGGSGYVEVHIDVRGGLTSGAAAPGGSISGGPGARRCGCEAGSAK